MFSSFTSWSFRRSPGCLSEQRRRTSKGGGGLKNLPQFRLLQFRLGPTAEARPNPHTHTAQHRWTGRGRNIHTLPRLFRCRARGKKRHGISTTFPGPSSRGAEAEDKFIRSQTRPELLRPCGAAPGPRSLPSLHFRRFFSSRISTSLARLRSNHHIPTSP